MSSVDFISQYWDWYLMIGFLLSLTSVIMEIKDEDFSDGVPTGIFINLSALIFFTILWPVLIISRLFGGGK